VLDFQCEAQRMHEVTLRRYEQDAIGGHWLPVASRRCDLANHI
jgi:hypothetical protein